MIYIPSTYLNDNYSYYFDGEKFIIYTNKNCESDTCDCYNIYQNNHYLVSDAYKCSMLDSNYSLSYERFTDDYYYRYDLASILICFSIIVGFGFGIPLYLLHQFKRSV